MGFPSLKRLRSCHPGIICEQLEERIVLDAAIASADSHNACDKHVCDSVSVGNDTHQNLTDLVHSDGDTVSNNAAHVFQNDLNVVLISNAIDNIQGLTHAASEKAEVVVFDAKNDDLNAVNALLKELLDTSGHKIDTLTIITHGGEGRVSIGAEEFNFFNVDDSQQAFEQLGSFMTEDGQIQIYSCFLAADFFGQSVVEDIASYTQADVFASVDSTGGPNGDWDLEYATDSESSLVSILDTDRLSDLTTELAQPYPSYENNWATAMGKVLYFVDNDGFSGKELWRSDGTAAGTYMLKDINVGAQDSNPEELIAINGTLYFKATDGNTALDHGIELWRSDGTAAGTYMVKDINPGNQSSDPTELTNVNGTLYFKASDGVTASDHGVELWRSDGTDAGTHMVTDMSPGNLSSDPTELTNVNGILYFRASDSNMAGLHRFRCHNGSHALEERRNCAWHVHG